MYLAFVQPLQTLRTVREEWEFENLSGVRVSISGVVVVAGGICYVFGRFKPLISGPKIWTSPWGPLP